MFTASEKKRITVTFAVTKREKQMIESVSKEVGASQSEVIRLGLGVGLPLVRKRSHEIQPN